MSTIDHTDTALAEEARDQIKSAPSGALEKLEGLQVGTTDRSGQAHSGLLGALHNLNRAVIELTAEITRKGPLPL